MAREYICLELGCGKRFLRPEHLSRRRLNREYGWRMSELLPRQTLNQIR